MVFLWVFLENPPFSRTVNPGKPSISMAQNVNSSSRMISSRRLAAGRDAGLAGEHFAVAS